MDIELSGMKCETCGSHLSNVIYRNDGEFWNKSYEFGCGLFKLHRGHDQRIFIRADCKNDPSRVARDRMRIAATNTILNDVKALSEVDDHYKQELTDMLLQLLDSYNL